MILLQKILPVENLASVKILQVAFPSPVGPLCDHVFRQLQYCSDKVWYWKWCPLPLPQHHHARARPLTYGLQFVLGPILCQASRNVQTICKHESQDYGKHWERALIFRYLDRAFVVTGFSNLSTALGLYGLREALDGPQDFILVCLANGFECRCKSLEEEHGIACFTSVCSSSTSDTICLIYIYLRCRLWQRESGQLRKIMNGGYFEQIRTMRVELPFLLKCCTA